MNMDLRELASQGRKRCRTFASTIEKWKINVMNDKQNQTQGGHLTYRYKKSAISISVYDPTGATIPAEIREALSNSVWAIAQEHKLLINIADE